VEEAAVEFRLSESAIYRALREQRLPGVKILGRWRISRSELVAHAALAARTQRARDPMPASRGHSPATRFRAKAESLRKRAQV
jgi:excisionase family DNA binding protein